MYLNGRHAVADDGPPNAYQIGECEVHVHSVLSPVCIRKRPAPHKIADKMTADLSTYTMAPDLLYCMASITRPDISCSMITM